MDEICSQLVAGNWTDEVTRSMVTPPGVDGRHRLRRFVDDEARRPRRVSLISLFLATHNQSLVPPPTTTAVTPTETATSSPVSLVAELFGDSVTLGLLPTVTVLGLILNSLAVVVIVGDRRCPASWRALRSLVVVVDVVLLTLFTIVIDVVAYFANMSLDVLNVLAAVAGLFQFAQPWILYIAATYVHRLLLDERHKVSPQRQVRYPLAQLIAMIVAGTVYFTLYTPPIRLLLYENIPHHSTLCTLPLFDQWQLSVGKTATSDLFYYLCYDCLYVLVVYLAPIVPVYYRYRRLVDAVFRRDYESAVVRSGPRAAALGSWAGVVSVTLGVHVVAHCTKSTLLAMRLGEAVAVEKYMAAGDGVFRLLNVVANLTVVLRPLCHLPVMVVYDHRLKTAALRAYRSFVATMLSYVAPRDELSEYSYESVELDSIVADDDALDNEDDVTNAVHV